MQPSLSPPRLTEAEVLDAAFRTGWSAELVNHPTRSMEYGSYLGTDLWKITITGLFILTPGGPSELPPELRPPPATTLVFFVSDRTGEVLETLAY